MHPLPIKAPLAGLHCISLLNPKKYTVERREGSIYHLKFKGWSHLISSLRISHTHRCNIHLLVPKLGNQQYSVYLLDGINNTRIHTHPVIYFIDNNQRVRVCPSQLHSKTGFRGVSTWQWFISSPTQVVPLNLSFYGVPLTEHNWQMKVKVASWSKQLRKLRVWLN